MKCGWSLVSERTRTSNSFHWFFFCLSMALDHRMHVASPRDPIRLSRTTAPVSSTSPRLSSRMARASAWWSMTWRRHSQETTNSTMIRPMYRNLRWRACCWKGLAILILLVSPAGSLPAEGGSVRVGDLAPLDEVEGEDAPGQQVLEQEHEGHRHVVGGDVEALG